MKQGRGRHRLPGALAAMGISAALALGLAGCSALPDSGSPQPFDVSVPTSDPLDLSADGPAKGSSPQALVKDFLLACAAGTTDDFATARQFLTDAASRSWHPETLVQVYATDTSPSFSGGGDADPDGGEGDGESTSAPEATPGAALTVTLTAAAVATVDDQGILTRADADARIVHEFALTAEDGEWRINALDDGVVLSETSFTSAYQQADLYFPSTTGDALVADPRWYPARRLATYLLAGLLGGPSEEIAPAVSSAIPEGATLPSQGVAITDHVAHVDLAATFPADDAAERLLAWQIQATLTQASTVSTVDLSVSGTGIDVDDLPAGPEYALDSAVALSEDGLVRVTGTSVAQTVVPRGELGENPRDPAIAPISGSTIAWLNADGLAVLSGTSGARTDHAVESPTAPSVDRWGWVWTASSAAGGAILVAGADGEDLTLDAPFRDSSAVEALRVSPDGARLAMLRVSGGTRSVWVAAIGRDAAGKPTSVGTPVAVSGLSVGIADVSWAGRTTVVALRDAGASSGAGPAAGGGSGGGAGGGSASASELATVPLGGFLTTLAFPSGKAERLTGGAASTNVYVTTSDGQVYARSGSVWQSVGGDLAGLRYPG